MSNIDFQKASARAYASMSEWLPGGRTEGPEYIVRNPTRHDSKPGSFKVNLQTGKWSDFATGDGGGDFCSLFAYVKGLSQLEAAKVLLGENPGHSGHFSSSPKVSHEAEPPRPKSADWEPVVPIPDNVPYPEMRHPMFGKPTATWDCYRTQENKIMFYIARYDPPGERKQFCPWSWCRKVGEDGREEFSWRAKLPPVPRPLAGLNLLTQYPERPVLVVSGEKCLQAAQMLLTDWVVVTWLNGDAGVEKTDWSPLKGRAVTVWGDNDEGGQASVKWIQRHLGGKPYMVSVPKGKRDKWDVYDAINEDGMTEGEIRALITPPTEVKEKSPWPFRALGYDHGTYYFLSGRSADVIEISGGAMGKKMLMTLADLSWWEMEFSGAKGPNWDLAQNTLIGLCQQMGPYDPSKVRGRGAWYDSGRPVLHLGDRIIADNDTHRIEAFDTSYIYERRPSIGSVEAEPLSHDEGAALIGSLHKLNWEQPGYAYLLAGFCMTSTICGALEWRSHAWLTGPSGSGKSWTMDHIVKPLMGENCLYVLGSSTEAGIRQKLGNDALPVILDEAEGDDQQQHVRIQNILTLMRQASSNDRAVVAKGTASGRNIEYSIRSSFLLSSIGVGVQHYADESRVSVLTLQVDRSPDAKSRFEALRAWCDRNITPEFSERFRARAIKLIPQIRENTRRFASAAAEKLGTQRLGDQLGTLLAGAYALEYDDIASDEAIMFYMHILEAAKDTNRRTTTDEIQCLQAIMQHQLTVDVSSGTKKTVTIGELIEAADGMYDSMIPQSEADRTLKNLGVRVRDRFVYFAQASEGLKGILKNSPWATNYARMLKRLPGAEGSEPMRFGPGVQQRATKLPVSAIIGDETLF